MIKKKIESKGHIVSFDKSIVDYFLTYKISMDNGKNYTRKYIDADYSDALRAAGNAMAGDPTIRHAKPFCFFKRFWRSREICCKRRK